jgi:hypothetical protein
MEELWKQLSEGFWDWHLQKDEVNLVIQQFHRNYSSFERIAFLHKKLMDPLNISLALEITAYMHEDELKELMPGLLNALIAYNGLTPRSEAIILKISKIWLLDNVERLVEPVLLSSDTDYAVYLCILGLYKQIDRDLTTRLAHRASNHSDPDIKEAGEDFLEG